MPASVAQHIAIIDRQLDDVIARISKAERAVGIVSAVDRALARFDAILARTGEIEHQLGRRIDVAEPDSSCKADPGAAGSSALHAALNAPDCSAVQRRLATELHEKGFKDFRFVR